MRRFFLLFIFDDPFGRRFISVKLHSKLQASEPKTQCQTFFYLFPCLMSSILDKFDKSPLLPDLLGIACPPCVRFILVYAVSARASRKLDSDSFLSYLPLLGVGTFGSLANSPASTRRKKSFNALSVITVHLRLSRALSSRRWTKQKQNHKLNHVLTHGLNQKSEAGHRPHHQKDGERQALSQMTTAIPRILTVNGGSSSIKFALFEAGMRQCGGSWRDESKASVCRRAASRQMARPRRITSPGRSPRLTITAAVTSADGLDSGKN